MNRIQRVVFDTSALVSAALRLGSAPRQAWLKALSFYDVCASAETLAEMEVVLDRSTFDRYLNREQRQTFAANVRRRVHLFEVRDVDLTKVGLACRDRATTCFSPLRW